MDPALYKDVITSRGLKYHYYFSPASPSTNPTILFVHGFPSTANDWRYQVAYFKALGYGLVVPDMLGYAGTDKPEDTAAYQASLICKDLVDILDAEEIRQPIAIGHDWGSRITGRLANFYPERFSAFAFLALSYTAPSPNFDFDQILEMTRKAVGYEAFGYWEFFSQEGADKVVEEHWDSYLSALFPGDAKLWITDIAPVGALKAYILADKKSARPEWLSEQDLQDISKVLREGGMKAPFQYYKVLTSGLVREDEKSIPESAYEIKKPVFYGAAMRDYVCLAALGKASIAKACTGPTTIREFDTGHWVMLEAKDEVNKELGDWIKGLQAL